MLNLLLYQINLTIYFSTSLSALAPQKISWYYALVLEPYIGFLFLSLCLSVFYLAAKCHTMYWAYERFFLTFVFWIKCCFGRMFVFPCYSVYLSLRWYVLSVRCLSAKCPLFHLCFGYMSIRPKVFRSHVLSVICLFSHLCFGHLSYHQISTSFNNNIGQPNQCSATFITWVSPKPSLDLLH